MADFPLRRAILWIRKVLEINVKTDVPESVSNEVVPKIDLFGWDRYSELEFETITSGIGASQVNFPLVPEGVNHLYVFGSARVNIAGPTNLWVGIFNAAGGTGITPSRSVINGERVSIQRPVLAPPGFALQGRSDAAVVGGNIVLEAFRIVLPPGEYVNAT